MTMANGGDISMWQQFGSWITGFVVFLLGIIGFFARREMSTMDTRVKGLEVKTEEQEDLISELDTDLKLNIQSDDFFRKELAGFKEEQVRTTSVLTKLYTKVELIEQRTK